MKFRLMLFVTLFALVTLGIAQDAQRDQPSAKSQERIVKEVRHELLMLPYFGVFDYIAFKVDGYTVTLTRFGREAGDQVRCRKLDQAH